MAADIVPIENTDALKSESLAWPERARALAVTDAESYARAAELIKGIKALAKHIEEKTADNISRWFKGHCAAVAEKAEMLAPLTEAEFIIKTIADSAPGTHWLVGTELNLVNRLSARLRPEGKTVEFMSPLVCMCSTMYRIDPPHLLWVLENLTQCRVVNRIAVPPVEAWLARLALQRMLDVSP